MAIRWRLPLAWALLIEALVVWPHPPELPQAWNGIGFDKFVHAGLFAVLAALVTRALVQEARPAWIALAASAAYAMFTELEQHFIPSRSMELGDFLADAVGATLGVVAFTVWAQRRREFSR
ncbi:MAG: VanZ family protein [Gemmatimonadaceae bacterium]